MNLISPLVAYLGYLVAAIFFIMALKGLSAPGSARRGNLLGAFGALLAVVITFLTPLPRGHEWHNVIPILVAVAVGTVIAVVAAKRVKMTDMPQLVALFNGAGGGAAALVAAMEITGGPQGIDSAIVSSLTIVIGAISFSGSIITFMKLQELMTTRPVTFPGGQYAFVGGLLASIALAVVVTLQATKGEVSIVLVIVLLLLACLVGVLFVLPVGGADVPIVISLLNAFTGLTVAGSGYVLGNVLLLVAGTLVGASGAILTKLMAEAMGRSLTNTLFGAFKAKAVTVTGTQEQRPVRSGSAEDVAILLNYAQKVIVVPGYGLAVAQAQHTMRELQEVLEGKGIEISYGIHPVAGRMPGHMNVLLAEADVPYESLKEMDEVNPQFPNTDVVLVVGANDVVNPAAKSDPSAPIYGMPILDVNQSRQVVFLKRSMRPGFAGIENELLYDPKTMLLFGDAKDSLNKVVNALKGLG